MDQNDSTHRALVVDSGSEEEEAVGEVFHEPFVLAVSYSVSWCCSVQQRIQSMRQFSEALDIFHIFYVFLDSDSEVVSESGHSSTHPWYMAGTGSVFALPEIFRKIGFSARRLQPVFPTSPWYVAVTCSVSVQHLPRPRNTGKMTRYFFYGPLYLAVNCSVQVCLRSACVDSSGRRLPEWFPCSALFWSTVDTCSGHPEFPSLATFHQLVSVTQDKHSRQVICPHHNHHNNSNNKEVSARA